MSYSLQCFPSEKYQTFPEANFYQRASRNIRKPCPISYVLKNTYGKIGFVKNRHDSVVIIAVV